MQPIFLISLPRSGSTLLQRLMMQHKDIASKSEPWLMLPLVYMFKDQGLVSEYDQRSSHMGVEDFISSLPNGETTFNQQLNDFVTGLYKEQCENGEVYFLDKTPRYYLIIEELARIFPKAKFIFLVRNPLQIIASIVSTFSNNTLRNLHFYNVDIFKGIDLIAKGIKSLERKCLVVRYEDIINDCPTTLKEIFDYLDLSNIKESNLELGNIKLRGRMGDKVGVESYSSVQSAGMDKWKGLFRERARWHFLRRIIKSLDKQVLTNYGYEKEHLLAQTKEIRVSTTFGSVKDILHIVSSRLIVKFYLNLFRPKVKAWSKKSILS